MTDGDYPPGAVRPRQWRQHARSDHKCALDLYCELIRTSPWRAGFLPPATAILAGRPKQELGHTHGRITLSVVGAYGRFPRYRVRPRWHHVRRTNHSRAGVALGGVVVSAIGYAAHTAYERFRLQNSLGSAALHANSPPQTMLSNARGVGVSLLTFRSVIISPCGHGHFAKTFVGRADPPPALVNAPKRVIRPALKSPI